MVDWKLVNLRYFKLNMLILVSHCNTCTISLNFSSESLVEHHSRIPKFEIFLCSTQIIFKDVQFLEKQTATLEIVNTGQVSILV